MPLSRYIFSTLLVPLIFIGGADAQISLWQIGGGGLAWQESDTTRVLIEVDEQVNRIRPVFFDETENMFLAVTGWSELINPRELGYLDGHQPRL